MNSRIYPVAIVGGGPVGLFTALLLARSGVECVVLERHPHILNHPKAMSLTGRTMQIFRSQGLENTLKGGALDMTGHDLAIWSRTLVGDIWGKIPLPHTSNDQLKCEAIHCPQTITEQTLLEALEKEPNASILFDHEVMSFATKPDGGLHLSIRRPISAIPLELNCRFLVAADGASSSIRRGLGIQAEGPGDQGHFLNIFFRASYGKHLHDRRAVLYQALDTGRFEAFVAVNGDDLWLMHHFLMPEESPSEFSNDRLTELIRAASGLENEPIEILGISPWVMSPKVAHRFRMGNTFLAGDASARLSPTGGLGMNTGLQSAHNLAWKLAAVVHGAPDTLLDSYETERRPVALASFHTADTFRKEVFEAIQAGIEGDFARVTSLVSASARTDNPGERLGVKYESGAFLSSALSGEHISTMPGELLPSLSLTDEEGPFSIHRWIGYDWVLISAGDSTAWQEAASQVTTFSQNPLIVRQVDGVGGAVDTDGKFWRSFGLNPGGAVLIRPDGFIAWICTDRPPSPTEALTQAMQKIFCTAS